MPIVRTALATALALAVATGPGVARAETTVPGSMTEIQLSFAPVVKAAAPSVVNIYAKRVVERGGLAGPFAQDPFFRRFFEGIAPRTQQVQNSLGSGVIVRADGLVVTNLHVVGQATEIRVVLTDRREFEAEILLADEDSDLVVLKLDGAQDLPALPLRDTAEVDVGDLVLAIGNPFGVGQTVTSGIVSALARTREAPGGGAGYYLQTDAAINPGNSGGALVDMRGRLLGINTAILSRSGGSIGIGFAVPSDLVAQVVTQAEAGRSTLARPWAGISGQPVDGALAEALGLERAQGLAISEVHPRSPFAQAGLARGDVLLSVDGRTVGAEPELAFRLSALGVGREAAVVWLSDGERREARLRLVAAPDEPARDLRRLPGPSPLGGLRRQGGGRGSGLVWGAPGLPPARRPASPGRAGGGDRPGPPAGRGRAAGRHGGRAGAAEPGAVGPAWGGQDHHRAAAGRGDGPVLRADLGDLHRGRGPAEGL